MSGAPPRELARLVRRIRKRALRWHLEPAEADRLVADVTLYAERCLAAGVPLSEFVPALTSDGEGSVRLFLPEHLRAVLHPGSRPPGAVLH